MLGLLLSLLLSQQVIRLDAVMERIPLPSTPVAQAVIVDAPAFTVRGTIADDETIVVMNLPGDHDYLWFCISMRLDGHSAEGDYVPRWCAPLDGHEHVVVRTILRWPPADAPGVWEVSGFVQWRDRPDQQENFGIEESPWTPLSR